MTSNAQRLFDFAARYLEKPLFSLIPHQPTLGKALDGAALVTRPLKGCAQRFTFLPDFRIRRMIPAGAGDNLLLYFHGGGFCVRNYLDGHDPKDPALSPRYADLSMVPPTALHVAEAEIVFDDAEDLARKLPQVDYHAWENVPHVWQVAAGWTPEADASLDTMAAYLNAHLP